MAQIRYNGEYCQFLGIISDKKNFQIAIALLGKGSMNRKELTDHTSIQGTSLSKRLEKLVTCGYVFRHKTGGEYRYSANEETMEPLIKLLNKHIDTHKENKLRS